MTGLIDFSTDAASNDTAAPPILWQEGQPANTVNNSARALMAALANWHGDNAGALVANRGGGDAYTLSTAQIFSAVTAAKAHTVSFLVSADNQGPATLSVDGNTARPILRRSSRQLGPGDLTAGIVYTARYVPSLSAYLIVSPAIERPGRLALQAEVTPDPGWLVANGQAVSRTAFAALFAVTGTTYGAGDGSTTFNVPNFNGGRAPMGPGLSGLGGIAGTIGSSGGFETVALTVAQMPVHNHGSITGVGGIHDHGATTGAAGAHDHGAATGQAGSHSHTGSTDPAGGHTHSGSTSANGDHTHGFTTAQNKTGSSGGNASTLWFGADIGTNTTTAGSHSHSLSIDAVTGHTHGVTTSTSANHGHSIAAAADHAHAIAAAPAHTHAIPIDGSSDAHPNMPPGLVVAFLIKT